MTPGHSFHLTFASRLCRLAPAGELERQTATGLMRPELERAARTGDVEVVKGQLKAGASVDSFDSHGQTPLMLAAHHGCLDVVDCLVRHGANSDLTAKYGLSALMLAIVAKHQAVAYTLVRAGVDLTIRGTGVPGFFGRSAYDLAAEQGMEELRATAEHDR
jgi:ankyrin repeat protein